MATDLNTAIPSWTASEVIAHFGDIPIARICTRPAPGEATESDVVQMHDRHDRLFELIDGTLVEKAMGWKESELAIIIARILGNYVQQHRLGKVFGSDGMLRLKPSQIRIPDVAFISKHRFAGLTPQSEVFWDLGCDLAVEVISPGNTRREMERKLADYFQAGVLAVWFVYSATREFVVYSSSEQSATLRGNDRLEGGSLLPGFSLLIGDVFAELHATEA